MTRVIRTALAGLALSLAACGGARPRAAEPATAPAAAPAPAPAAPVGSLYERLGGLAAIEAVVKHFVAVVAADARINGFFVNTEIPRLEQMLVEQICAATGGPCTYTGKDMVTVHA